MGITNKDVLKTVAIDVPNMKSQMDNTVTYITPQQLGAKGDGVTDDTMAIKSTIEYAINNKIKKIVFPCVKNGYCSNDTLSFIGDLNVVMESPIIYTGAQDKPCIVVGEITKYTNSKELKLQAVSKTQSTWLDYHENKNVNSINIGILIHNLAQCNNCEIVKSVGFTVGLEVLASNGLGNYFNNYTLGELRNNKVALEIASISDNGSGWANANIFNGGSMTCNGNVNMDKDRYYLKHTRRSGDYWSNSNIFKNPRFEGGKPTPPAKCYPIIFGSSNQNRIIDCRIENASDDMLIDFGGSVENIVTSINTINNSTTLLGNSSIYSRNKFISNTAQNKDYQTLVYQSPNLKNDLIIDTTNNGKVWCQGILFNGWDLNDYAKYLIHEANLPKYIPTENVMEFSGYAKPTVFIDCTTCKNYLIEGDFGNGKITIMLFDENKNNITSIDKVKDSNMTYYLFNGYLMSNIDKPANTPFTVTLSDDVKEFCISFVKVNSFKVTALNGTASVTRNKKHMKSIPSKKGRILEVSYNDDNISAITPVYSIMTKDNER